MLIAQISPASRGHVATVTAPALTRAASFLLYLFLLKGTYVLLEIYVLLYLFGTPHPYPSQLRVFPHGCPQPSRTWGFCSWFIHLSHGSTLHLCTSWVIIFCS